MDRDSTSGPTGVLKRVLSSTPFQRVAAIKTARQVQLPGDRLALHAQLEIVLLFRYLCRQRDQTDVHVRLGDTPTRRSVFPPI